MQEIGQNVRSLRKERGVTLRRFGMMVGMDKTYLSGIENGKRNATVSTLERIADGLDVPLEDLFRGVGSSRRPQTPSSPDAPARSAASPREQ